MIQPSEMKLDLPVELANGVMTTTSKAWEILAASKNGETEVVRKLVDECPELVYAQYNYTPPIHFAVREGHAALVNFLLDKGALDPGYITYPFKDTMLTVAGDRGFEEIVSLLKEYLDHPDRCKYKGDNGTIIYEMTEEMKAFQKAVNHDDMITAEKMLKQNSRLALTEFASWGEGIMAVPANHRNFKMLELLMSYGAHVPKISKWGRAYYFKHYDVAKFLLEKGMDANHMTWHRVTLLHDMAQEGNIQKAELLTGHGAELDPLEEEYRSTPLGLAARWGHVEMVKWLLEKGADPNKAGAAWSTPIAWAKKKGQREIARILS